MTTTVDPSTLVGGRYVLEKLIGEGGTGEVWRARHVTLRSPVAIKLLHGSAAFRESTRRRFLTEARVAAQLSTRHAVKVFDFGVTDQGRPYLIMELLDGETLSDRLERVHMLTPYATARILRLASRALDAAHALGVVHRDFKPENIFLVRTEEDEEDVKVVDFGVAKLVGELEEDVEDAAPMSSRRLDKAFVSFTRTGKSVGTPCYMAPEQAKGDLDVGPAADVWAVGVVAYECLTGYRPFVAQDIDTLFDRISHCTYVPARERNPSLPADFDTWFQRACAPNPDKRFPNASAATMALIEVLGIQSSAITLADVEAVHSLLPSVRSPSSAPAGPPSSRGEGRSFTPGASSAERELPKVRRPRTVRNFVFAAAVLAMTAIGVGSWWHLRNVPVPPEGDTRVSEPSATGVASTEHPVDVEAPAPSAIAASNGSAAPAASDARTDPEVGKAPAGGTGRSDPAVPPRMDGYRDLPSAWPKASSPPPASPPPSAESPPPEKEQPSSKPPDPPAPKSSATSSPFKLPELGF